MAKKRLKLHHGFIFSLKEVISMVRRFRQKFIDKYFWDKNESREAKHYLEHIRIFLYKKKPKVYKQIFGNLQKISINRFKRGYATKSFIFKTESGKWVLKVGHQFSTVAGLTDPSHPHYPKEYRNYLRLLKKHTQKNNYLRKLVPTPQEVFFVTAKKNSPYRQTTLILQPFIQTLSEKDLRKNITEKNYQDLLGQLGEFQKLTDHLIKKHKVHPDLMGEGNLEITVEEGKLHLVLIDAGLIDLNPPLPLTHATIKVTSSMTIKKLKTLIEQLNPQLSY